MNGFYLFGLCIFVEGNRKDMKAQDVIEINSEILAGTPVFKGTRVAIKTLFDYLEVSSLDDFLEGFPTVSREQAEAVIKPMAIIA